MSSIEIISNEKFNVISNMIFCQRSVPVNLYIPTSMFSFDEIPEEITAHLFFTTHHNRINRRMPRCQGLRHRGLWWPRRSSGPDDICQQDIICSCGWSHDPDQCEIGEPRRLQLWDQYGGTEEINSEDQCHEFLGRSGCRFPRPCGFPASGNHGRSGKQYRERVHDRGVHVDRRRDHSGNSFLLQYHGRIYSPGNLSKLGHGR